MGNWNLAESSRMSTKTGGKHTFHVGIYEVDIELKRESCSEVFQDERCAVQLDRFRAF